MCIVNVSTFHFGASTSPPPPQKEGKRREIDEGLIIFLPLSRAETVEAWYTGDVFAKGLISMS